MHRRTCNYALLSALQADRLFGTAQTPPSSATRLRKALCTCVPSFRVGDAATREWPREQNLRQNTVLLSVFAMQKTPISGVMDVSNVSIFAARLPELVHKQRSTQGSRMLARVQVACDLIKVTVQVLVRQTQLS